MEQNRQRIQQLRQNNKLLRQKLSTKMAVGHSLRLHFITDRPHYLQADDDVITEAFKSHQLKPPAELRGITGEVGSC